MQRLIFMLTDFFERLKRFMVSAVKRILFYFNPKSLKSASAKVAGLDYNILRNVKSGKKIPSWNQLKYFNRFFNVLERRVFNISLAVWVLSLFILLGTYVHNHTISAPKNGGEYSEALIGQPKYINPLFSGANEVDGNIASLVYAGLFAYDENGTLVPELAESYDISDDKKSYTIRLKPNLHWSDNHLFTANDVIYTWEMIQNPEVGSPLFSTFQSVTVEKQDELTVKFNLQQPFAPFLNSLTVGILPEHVWGDTAPENIKLSKYNIQPIGIGAWKFEKLIKDDSGFIQTYNLTKNDYYFGEKPYLNNLVFKFFNDYNTAIDSVRGQTVDALSFVPRESKNKLNTKNVVNYDLHLPQYTALFFNVNNDLAKNVEVRKALGGSINKEDLVDIAVQGDGVLVDGPILPGQLGYDDMLKRYSLTIAEANEKLDKVWSRITPGEYFKMLENQLSKERASTSTTSSTPETADAIATQARNSMNSEQQFYRKTKDGAVITYVLATADTPEYHAAAEYIAKIWRSLGIQTNINFVTPRQLSREVLRNHNYTALLYGEVVGNDPDLLPFWHSSQINYPGLNVSQWSDKTSDKLLEEARVTFDNAKRGEMYRQFQKLLVENMPAVFLYSPSHVFAVNKRIKGIALSAVATPESRYRGMHNWFVKTAWKFVK